MRERFSSVDDLVLRVPLLNRKELALLASVGALNTLDGDVCGHGFVCFEQADAGAVEVDANGVRVDC
jgi:hypothetical protein